VFQCLVFGDHARDARESLANRRGHDGGRDAGGAVTALDVVDPNDREWTIDLTCNAVDEGHSELLRAAVEVVDGARVIAMSDRTFLLHLGGTIRSSQGLAQDPRRPLDGLHPGVARISMAIAKDRRPRANDDQAAIPSPS